MREITDTRNNINTIKIKIMGLDMYLNKRTYVKQWDFQKDDERHEVTVKKGGEPHPHIKTERISEVTEQVGYWRKANQIHQWFVDNVQDGMDDCKEHMVERDQLKELLDICIKIKELYAKDKYEFEEYAREHLPTSQGFFFGQYEYGDDYMYDINETIEILQVVYENNDGAWQHHFTYESSW